MDTTTENILNVTLLEPRLKHPTIFARFDELNEGETLIIDNDHDPKPLYYQLLGQRGDIFTWEYLQQGPERWMIKITKRVTGENEETLGEIAAKDIRKAQIFKKYGLDFCCGGAKTVREACAEKGLDVAAVERELQQSDKVAATRPLPYNEWELDFLADYIVNTHHSYIKKMIPDMRAYAAKVAKVHGERHPELLPIHRLVEDMSAELTGHMAEEERVLFPFIKEIVSAKKNNTPLKRDSCGSVDEPVKMMQEEHESVAKKMDKINELSDHYTLPEDACASYSLLFRMLSEFEEDLHIHVHLENNILFPKTLALAKEVK